MRLPASLAPARLTVALAILDPRSEKPAIHLANGGKDASGNVKFADTGVFLRDRIREHFGKIGVEVNVKCHWKSRAKPEET